MENMKRVLRQSEGISKTGVSETVVSVAGPVPCRRFLPWGSLFDHTILPPLS